MGTNIVTDIESLPKRHRCLQPSDSPHDVKRLQVERSSARSQPQTSLRRGVEIAV